MGLKNYDVTIDGHETTLRLSDEDAQRMGLTGKPAAAPAPAEADAAPAKKAPAPANKARCAPNKATKTTRARKS